MMPKNFFLAAALVALAGSAARADNIGLSVGVGVNIRPVGAVSAPPGAVSGPSSAIMRVSSVSTPPSLYVGAAPSYIGAPPSYIGAPPSYIGAPPSYIGAPPSFIGNPPSYIGAPPSYIGPPVAMPTFNNYPYYAPPRTIVVTPYTVRPGLGANFTVQVQPMQFYYPNYGAPVTPSFAQPSRLSHGPLNNR